MIKQNDLNYYFHLCEFVSFCISQEIARVIFEGKADIQSDPFLYKVCVTDIKRYCNDIPAGHGRRKLFHM